MRVRGFVLEVALTRWCAQPFMRYHRECSLYGHSTPFARHLVLLHIPRSKISILANCRDLLCNTEQISGSIEDVALILGTRGTGRVARHQLSYSSENCRQQLAALSVMTNPCVDLREAGADVTGGADRNDCLISQTSAPTRKIKR